MSECMCEYVCVCVWLESGSVNLEIMFIIKLNVVLIDVRLQWGIQIGLI